MIENVQAYWDTRPCNISHSSALVGTQEWSTEVSQRKYFVEPHIIPFAEFWNWNGKRVLEIGCGLGTDTITFAQYGAQVTAVDLSPFSLQLATQRAKLHNVAHKITFQEANAECLVAKLPIQPFDLIYSFGVLHHTPNPVQALAQVRLYADEYTWLKLMLYNRLSTKALRLALSGGIRRQSEAQSNCPITWAYTQAQARALVESAGFTVERIQVAHIFPYQIEPYKRYEYVKAFPWNVLPKAVFQRLESIVGWHLLIDARVA